MALQTEAYWKTFIQTAGITDEVVSSTYPKAFSDNGFNASLALLDKEILSEIEITLLGYKLAILQSASKQHSPPAQSLSVAKATVNAHLSALHWK